MEGFDEAALIDVLSPDAIRSIDEPTFDPHRQAGWLPARAPVVMFEHGGIARAYPLGILTRHEVVNDTVAGVPVVVTYCPLCNSAIVYRRAQGGRTLTFGVSGKLYLSNLVLFDRETLSLWPQMRGVAARGELRGTELSPLPSSIVAFSEFTDRHPEGEVLSRPARGEYDENPYVGYDTAEGPSAGYLTATIDARLDPMMRVVGVAIEKEARAYPFDTLEDVLAINDTLAGTDIVILWGGDAASALDGPRIADGRSVGSSGVFAPHVGGRTLTFERRGEAIVDVQTMSTWSHLGVATAGTLAGAELEPLSHLDAFWFAWSSFVPFTQVWASEGAPVRAPVG